MANSCPVGYLAGGPHGGHPVSPPSDAGATASPGPSSPGGPECEPTSPTSPDSSTPGPFSGQSAMKSRRQSAQIKRLSIVEDDDNVTQHLVETPMRKTNSLRHKHSSRIRAVTEQLSATPEDSSFLTDVFNFSRLRLSTGGLHLGQGSMENNSPRKSLISSMASRFSINTQVTRDPTSRGLFWKHHTEMLSRLANEYPEDYTLEGVPIGIVPSLSVMRQGEEKVEADHSSEWSLASPSGSASFEFSWKLRDRTRGKPVDMKPDLILTRKSSRASSRCSSGCDSDSFGGFGKGNSFSESSDDEENPPFDLPPWLLMRLHGGDGDHEDDDGSSSGGLSDVSA